MQTQSGNYKSKLNVNIFQFLKGKHRSAKYKSKTKVGIFFQFPKGKLRSGKYKSKANVNILKGKCRSTYKSKAR